MTLHVQPLALECKRLQAPRLLAARAAAPIAVLGSSVAPASTSTQGEASTGRAARATPGLNSVPWRRVRTGFIAGEADNADSHGGGFQADTRGRAVRHRGNPLAGKQ